MVSITVGITTFMCESQIFGIFKEDAIWIKMSGRDAFCEYEPNIIESHS